MVLRINSFIDKCILCRPYNNKIFDNKLSKLKNVDPTNEYLNVFNLNKFSEVLHAAAVLLALVNSKLYYIRGTT